MPLVSFPAMDLHFVPSGRTVTIPKTVVKRSARYASDMMDDGELSCLAAAALSFPWKPDSIVVEIGSFAGMTAAFLAETLFDAGHLNHVLSIDPFERAPTTPGNPAGSYSRYLETMRSRGLEDRCLPLVAFSYQAAPVVPDRIGLLIVDGNHDYESVAEDLALYAPKVLPGGYIFLDDYTDAYPGVQRATTEFLAEHSEFTLVHEAWFVILQRI